MFTGIVEATACILKKSGTDLVIERPSSFDDVIVGSSISILGVCLTITGLEADSMAFDTVPETLSKSKLGELKVGDMVNLERALKASDRFEGHIVQGHVEGVGRVVRPSDLGPREEQGTEVRSPKSEVLTISIPTHLTSLVTSKGSIAIDGVSLTVAEVQNNQCSIALIPHTLQHTTLGALKEGDWVNIETDILGRYVHALLPSS